MTFSKAILLFIFSPNFKHIELKAYIRVERCPSCIAKPTKYSHSYGLDIIFKLCLMYSYEFNIDFLWLTINPIVPLDCVLSYAKNFFETKSKSKMLCPMYTYLIAYPRQTLAGFSVVRMVLWYMLL